MKLKNIIWLVVICLLLSVLMVGCNTTSTQKESTTPLSTKATKAPTVTHPEPITIWSPLGSGLVTSNEEIIPWKVSQENTGIDVEFINPAQGLEDDAFNLMIASGEFPDIIYYNFLHYPGGPIAALNNEIIIPLNDVLAEGAPNYNAYLEAYPDVKKMVVTDEAIHYQVAGIFTWEPDESLGMTPVLERKPFYEAWLGLIIRKDYLESVGLDMPETVDDWTEALRAFKNELNIETPFSPVADNLKKCNAFAGAMGISVGLYCDENGKVKYGPMQDEYKDYLTLLNTWYKEELLDPDFAALDSATTKNKAVNGTTGAWVGTGSTWIGKVHASALELDPNSTFYPAAAPHPKKSDGENQAMYAQKSYPFTAGAAISTDCEDVQTALAYLDYFWTDEGALLGNFGTESVSFTYNENGLPTWLPEGEIQVKSKDLAWILNGAYPMDNRNRLELRKSYPIPDAYTCSQLWSDSAKYSTSMPPFVIPSEKSDTYATLGNELQTYCDEMYIKFVMGLEDLEKFEDFQQTLTDIGVEEYIAIAQEALDNYNAR